MPTLVDSNILLDVLTRDVRWYEWSARVLQEQAERGMLCINPIIYAEVSIGFDRIEDVDDALPVSYFSREPLPLEAAFLAGKCFVTYRKRGGLKHAPLPDFFIGAHAAIMNWPLITRDSGRYATYFPSLTLIAPET